jgi:hypothetical protein
MGDGADKWRNGNTAQLSAITNHHRVFPNSKDDYTPGNDLMMTMRCVWEWKWAWGAFQSMPRSESENYIHGIFQSVVRPTLSLGLDSSS